MAGIRIHFGRGTTLRKKRKGKGGSQTRKWEPGHPHGNMPKKSHRRTPPT